MVNYALLLVVLVSPAMQPQPLGKLVGTLSVQSGKVRVERPGKDPAMAPRMQRLRVNDKIVVVEKGKMTVTLDAVREIWQLPDAGALMVEAKGLRALTPSPAILVRRVAATGRVAGPPARALGGKIRSGAPRVSPFGAIAQGPVEVTWTTMGAGKVRVELSDAKGKSLWVQPSATGTTRVLPEKVTKPGTWVRVQVLGGEVAASAWLIVMTPAQRAAAEAEEKALRAALADDPVALGDALGSMWAERRMASRFAEAAKLVFGSTETAEAQWRIGEWCEVAGFPGGALAAYTAAWNLGGRDPELKAAIERLGGEAKIPEWETLAATRDRLMGEQKFAEALPVAERVVEILRKERPESVELGKALTKVGNLHQRLGQLDKADDLLAQAVSVLEVVAGPGSLPVAEALNQQAYVAAGRQELILAEKKWGQVLAILEKLVPDSEEVAQTIYNLGCIAAGGPNQDLAQSRFEAALALYERLAPGSLDVADCLNNLGSVLADRGDLGSAQRRYETALALYERLAPDSLGTARTMYNLGLIESDRGDLDLAQRRLEAVLVLYKRHAPDSLLVADTLSSLGTLATDRGDLDLAQLRHEAALALREKLAPGTLDMAGSLNNLGNVAADRGDLDLAQRLHEAALALYERLAPGSLDVARSMNNLGIVAADRGELDLAQRRYEAALAIQEKLAPGSLDVAASLCNLGIISRARGELELAHRRFEAALVIREKLAAGTLDVASSLNNLGNVAADRGDLDLAEQLHGAALAFREKLSAGSLDVAKNLNNLGNVAADRGDQRALAALHGKQLELAANLLTSQGASRASELGSIGTEATGPFLASVGSTRPNPSTPGSLPFAGPGSPSRLGQRSVSAPRKPTRRSAKPGAPSRSRLSKRPTS